MIITTKPLKIKLKNTQNPLDEFKKLNRTDPSKTKEVLFVRYIGISDSVELYKEHILEIDRHLSSMPYLRLKKLEVISRLEDIKRLSKVWEDWQPFMKGSTTNPFVFYHVPLCGHLHDERLEWTKKLVFIEVLSMYKKVNQHSNDTLFKNFVIKFLNWMELYLPKLFNSEKAPKVMFIGDIKQHEILFLYFLSRLGCDICYMNPKEDIVHLYPEIENFSTLYRCSSLYSESIVLPDVLSTQNKKMIQEQEIVQPVISKVRRREELSYEQLAGLSNSVVMIKNYDEQNNIICYGSGVVIHSNGYILTNLHVVAGGHYFSILYENETEEYVTDHFIKYHQLYDLAIIKVEKKSSPLTVKTNDRLVRGQKIVAIGSPLGLFNSVSDGIVSGFRDINGIPMIQFTAPISDGSSGGALLDMYGRLVGLITAGYNKGQNLNLAVPYEKIYEFGHNFIEHHD